MNIKAMICADVDSKSEIKKMEGWLDKWRSQFSYISKNIGCGCCIRAFNIEGPEEAFNEIPKLVITVGGLSG